jgi:outer membrane protein TolC
MDTEETFNLHSIGFNFNFPGVSIPSLVGPFNVMDVRARVSQTIADFTALNNYRSARETVHAGDFASQDARDLVVLAVAGAYLQVLAAEARLQSAQAQLATAKALDERTAKQLEFGKAAQIDLNRSHVEVLLNQQRMVTLQNDLAKQKITLARMIGVPPSAAYDLTNEIPFAPGPSLTVDEAIKKAMDRRADLKAAEVQVRAAERALAAARAERYPSASANADYGDIGGPSDLRPTYTVSVTLNLPIWNGGRTGADIQQAEAALAQRRAELEDTRSQVESDVRNAYLDLEAAANQVQVSQQNTGLMGETLHQTRERFEAGVSENTDVVQSQESVAGANLDYIDSVFAHNLAKLSLARALGNSPEELDQFLSVEPHR